MTKHVTYNGILFLHHEETYEVRKNQTGIIKYYTRVDTGESGMSIRGLANACGVALSGLQKLLNNPTFFEKVTTKTEKKEIISLDKKEKKVTTKPNIYLIKSDDVHVICDTFCERVIYYYAFESSYKKTKARELYQALAQYGLRQFIQSKTGYQPTLAPQHDNSLTLSVEEQLKQAMAINEELESKLVTQQEQFKEELTEKDDAIQKLKQRLTLSDEKSHQVYLQEMLGGEMEMPVDGPFPGRIDLVTKQMVVEIKSITHFEQAFGQLLRYRFKLKGTEHENKTYMLYLFGNLTADERQVLDGMSELADFQLMLKTDSADCVDAKQEVANKDAIAIPPVAVS